MPKPIKKDKSKKATNSGNASGSTAQSTLNDKSGEEKDHSDTNLECICENTK